MSEPLDRAEVMRQLEILAATKTGEMIPDFLSKPNGWGEALSELAAAAARLIPDPRIVFDASRDVVTICGINYAMALFEHMGCGPSDKLFRIVDRGDGVVTIQMIEAAP